MAQWVKNSPAMQETQEMWVQFLDQEDLLGKGMTTHSSSLAWRIPQTEEPRGLQSIGLQESDPTKETEHACERSKLRYCYKKSRDFNTQNVMQPLSITRQVSIYYLEIKRLFTIVC